MTGIRRKDDIRETLHLRSRSKVNLLPWHFVFRLRAAVFEKLPNAIKHFMLARGSPQLILLYSLVHQGQSVGHIGTLQLNIHHISTAD